MHCTFITELQIFIILRLCMFLNFQWFPTPLKQDLCIVHSAMYMFWLDQYNILILLIRARELAQKHL